MGTLNPSFAAEDQEKIEDGDYGDAEVIGPPAYASPDPITMTHALVPVERHSGNLSPDYGQGQGDTLGAADTMTAHTQGDETGDEDANPDDKLLSADWIGEIEKAKDKEALGAIKERYDDSDHKQWTTVDKAFDDKYGTLDN